MTDPLRYYLAEGFIALFYYPNLNEFGKFSGRFRNTVNVKDNISVITFNGKKCLRVLNVAYPVNSDFWLDYGIRCADEAEALAKSNEWAKETNELHEIFAKQNETTA